MLVGTLPKYSRERHVVGIWHILVVGLIGEEAGFIQSQPSPRPTRHDPAVGLRREMR